LTGQVNNYYKVFERLKMQETNVTSWKMTTKSIDEGLKSGEIKYLLRDRKTIDREYLSTIANIKRFLERWSGDREFREALPQDPYGVTRRYNLDVDPEELRILWDLDYANSYDPNAAIPLKVIQYSTHIRQCIAHRENLRKQGTPSNARFKAWRERQICRLGSQFGSTSADRIVHPPFTVELSKGCSVGCWFCGVAAQRLEEVFPYSPENVVLWRGVLEVLKDIIGSGASEGFCYWATDPMDNPDYEKFLTDYHSILGSLPQTTTTSSIRDPQRTKNFLKLSQAKDGWIERFSILTLEQLNKVHKEFSAEELMFVELVLQNDEATNTKAFAGRAREKRFRKRLETSGQKIDSSESTVVGNTIACVSGFLLNMVDRSVKLISPCEASEERPLGYIIYDEANFNSASELRDVLNQMIDKNMSLTINLQDRISFRADLKSEKIDQDLCLSSPAAKYYLGDSPYLQEITEVIFNENLTAGELALLMEQRKGVALTHTLNSLNEFFKQGMLESQVALPT
jgi:radical SAM family RiPP maturation amino acid epimerase